MSPSSLRAAALLVAMCAQPVSAQTRFAALGDIGRSTDATAVANFVKGQDPDYIISVGDNCYGQPPISQQIGDRYGNFVLFRRFWSVIGNHEYDSPCGNNSLGYLTFFDFPNNERYYDVRLGPVHFFMINSNNEEPDGRSATSAQAKWIQTRIQGSTAPWQVVVLHHPPYSSGRHGSTQVMQWPFEQWGADAVLSGHDHDYERILRNDNNDRKKIPYFVTGLGGREKGPFKREVTGSAFRYNAEFGALFITATDTQLKFQFRNIKGTVVDSYALSK